MTASHTSALIELLGWAAALLTLCTFICSDMRRLRILALAANASFIAYGVSAQLTPVLALHLVLVPVNLWRLAHALRAGAAQSAQAVANNDPALHSSPPQSRAARCAKPPRRYTAVRRAAHVGIPGYRPPRPGRSTLYITGVPQ